MPDRFGARLRQRREERGIDLVTIARQTKIKQTLLEALERDDVSQWPTGVYRRAFIRAYARAIDFDPDTMVREFNECFPEPPEIDVVAAMASMRESADPDSPTLDRVRSVVGLAIGSLARLRRTGTPAAAPATSVAPHAPARAEAAVAPEELSDRRPVAPAPPEPDLLAVAGLCTELARVDNINELRPLLREAAKLLDATGLIVWLWDTVTAELRPAVVQGYSDRVVGQLPTVRKDADNATALAFRSERVCEVSPNEQVKGALVVPLLTPAGCSGVLAIELQRGVEPPKSLRAIATIFAAVLAQMTVHVAPREMETPTLRISPQWGT
jgi:transcriptional regulator with XRE-family HTH domain